MAENKVTIINRYKGTTPDDPKHWSKQIKKSLVFKDKHGSLNLIMLGGACDASFPYIASIDHKKIKNASKTSKLCEGDVVVEVGGEGVGGCTLNDVIELISQLPSQVTIKTVAADLLPLSLSAYLNEKFPKNSPDHCLQQTIRRNIYKRALPCTTRRPREGEVDGVDYKFLTVDEFMLLEKEGRLLEKGKYEGNFYGTLKPQPPPGASSSSHNHVIPWAGLPEHLYSMVKKSKPSNASAHNSLHNSAHTCSHNSSHTSSHASSTPPLHATSRASSTPPSPPHSHTSTHPSHTTPHASSTPTPHNNNASHTPSTPHSNRPDFSPPSTPQITPHSSFNKHHSKSVTNSSHSSSVTLNLSHSSTYTKSSSSSPFSTSSLTTVVNANPPSTHLNFTSFTDVSSSTTQPADTRTTPNLFFTDDNSASDDLTSEDFEPINHNNINNHNKNINNHNNNINNHNNKNNTNNKNSNNHYQKNNTDAQNSSEASPNHSQPPQGAPQAATEACNQPVQQLIQTTLVKSAKGLGFSIIGVEDDESEGVWLVVKRLNSAGPAGVDNKLKRGDVLVSVNGREVCGLTHHDVVTMFKAIEVGDRVSLEVVRGHHSTHNFDLLEASQGADSSLEVVTTLAVTEEDEEEEGGVEEVLVQVLKGAAGFGFTLADRVGGQKVKQVVDVDRCEGLREGDLLVQVNSVPLAPLTHLQVVELLKSLPVAVPASFTLQRRVASKTSVSNNSTLNLQNLSHPPPPPRTINMKLPLQPCYHNNNNNNLIQHHHQQQQQHGNNDILERTQTSLQTPDFIPDIAFKEPHVLDVISNTTNNNSMNYNNSSMTYNNSNNSMTYNNNNQQDTHTCFQQQHVHHNKPLFLPCSTQDLVQVTLHKSLHGFGFRIIGGREEGSQVSIGLIVPGGPADQSGLMKLGQEILFIDHKCVIGAWHRDVVDLVLMASKTGIVHLALSNSVHSGAYDLSSHCGHSSDDSVSEVVLSRSSEEGFGFYILSSCSSATPVIGEIIENSPASRCGGLRVGSEIVAINDRLLRGLSHVEIVEVIKAAGTVIKLLVLNRAGECGACDGALLQQSVSPMLLPSLHSPALVPQPHLQPLMQPHFQPHFHLHQQLQLQYYQQQLQQYQQLPSQANTQELEVQLVRGHKGYGFSIRGGCDMNNTPMLVSKVLEGGVALQDGTLQVGDELTIINGVSTFGMTHQEAINSIQSASEVLNLKVKRFLTAENEEDL